MQREIEHLGLGTVVPNSAQIVDFLKAVVEDKDHLAEMGRRARRLFDEKYSRVITMAHWRTLLSDLASSR